MVQMKGHVCGCAEDMKELPDDHFDVVIMTFVLCSAGNGAKVLEEIKRVLVKLIGLVCLLPIPLLHKGKDALYVLFFRWGTIIWRDCFEKARDIALKPLDALISHYPDLRKRGALRVLEIGGGLGHNFEFFNRPVLYTNVDPNPEFNVHFKKKLENFPKVELEKWIQAYGENMTQLENGSFDVVLCTYMMCSVKDVQKVLSEARRVLVKGGHLIFLDHVGYPKGTWLRWMQDILSPLWKVALCNCCLNLDTEEHIRASGFSEVTVRYFDVDIPLLSRQICGVAVA
ncbi:thiol S-methyltransferase TMT1B-like isoform X2 [Haemaphysalis longicornis]